MFAASKTQPAGLVQTVMYSTTVVQPTCSFTDSLRVVTSPHKLQINKSCTFVIFFTFVNRINLTHLHKMEDEDREDSTSDQNISTWVKMETGDEEVSNSFFRTLFHQFLFLQSRRPILRTGRTGLHFSPPAGSSRQCTATPQTGPSCWHPGARCSTQS